MSRPGPSEAVAQGHALPGSSQSKIAVAPMTPKRANEYVVAWHRHHGPLPGGYAWWAVAALADEEVVGVAIAGRPTNRNNDDGWTVELLRLATNGTPNAASCLLGACAKAARAIGAKRIITYTLETESGVSLRAAGWVEEARGIQSWWTHAGSRPPAQYRDHMDVLKVRWANTLFELPAALTPAPQEGEE